MIAPLAHAQSLHNAFVTAIYNSPTAIQNLRRAEQWNQRNALLAYAKMQFLVKNRHYREAVTLFLNLPKNPQYLLAPKIWWRQQKSLIRKLLDSHEPGLAYKLASRPLLHHSIALTSAHFYSGWIALRFLNLPKTAAHHFSALLKDSTAVDSRARAYYWLGRSLLRLNDLRSAKQAFSKAAHYGTTYYGQLASAQIGQKTLSLPTPHIAPKDEHFFSSLFFVRVLKRLAQAGYHNHTLLLYRKIADSVKHTSQLTFLAQMAAQHKDYYSCVKLSQLAEGRGLSLGKIGFPLGGIPQKAEQTSNNKAFTYAVARQESAFNKKATSYVGAQGLLQLMPATAKNVARKNRMPYSLQRLCTDPLYNATLGTLLLNDLIKQFNGSYVLTLIGYNAGPGRAKNWSMQYGDPRTLSTEEVIDWVERVPFDETRGYIMRVMENYEVYRMYLGKPVNLAQDLRAGHP